MHKVSVIGLGKLGLPLALCLASRNFQVMGVDLNPHLISKLKNGPFQYTEPKTQELWNHYGQNIRFFNSLENAILETETTFFIVPTPSREDGRFSLLPLLTALRDFCQLLRKKTHGRHTLVVTSTVLPGDFENEILPLICEARKATPGLEIKIYYQPWFVALGNVCEGILNPSFILLGTESKEEDPTLIKMYRQLVGSSVSIQSMNLINAEITKISLNSFITTKITFANMISQLCESLPGANIDIVSTALQQDPRIGKGYLKGGGSYGGPCFPRDNRALASVLIKQDIDSSLPSLVDTLNRKVSESLISLVLKERCAEGKVAVLGLSYKPNTSEVECSEASKLINALKEREVPFVVHDPIIENTNLIDILTGADVVVICTPCEEYRRLPIEMIPKENRPNVLIDCWRVAEANKTKKYIGRGIGI